MGEQAHIDERALAHPCRIHDEHDQQYGSDHRGHEHVTAGEPAGLAAVGEPVEDPDDARGEKNESQHVQPRPRRGPVARQHLPGEEEADDAERHVDPEHPPPVEPIQDHSTEHRAEDRTENGRQAHHRHGSSERLSAGRLHHQGRHQRQHQASADSLHHSEGDQAGRTPGEAGGDRTDHEDQKCEHPEALTPETGLRPSDQWNCDAKREEVAGTHPLDNRDRGVQLHGQSAQRDSDDGRVEDHGQTADDEHHSDVQHVPVDSVIGDWAAHRILH